MERPPVEQTAFENAISWARRGTCPRRKVGCVLMDAGFRTLATGYNGVPNKTPHCGEKLSICQGAQFASGTNLHKCHAVHAEVNALLQCKDRHLLEHVFCTTEPCTPCATMILNANPGAKPPFVHFLNTYPASEGRALWEQRGYLSRWQQYQITPELQLYLGDLKI